jgi:hypothetical protein
VFERKREMSSILQNSGADGVGEKVVREVSWWRGETWASGCPD